MGLVFERRDCDGISWLHSACSCKLSVAATLQKATQSAWQPVPVGAGDRLAEDGLFMCGVFTGSTSSGAPSLSGFISLESSDVTSRNQGCIFLWNSSSLFIFCAAYLQLRSILLDSHIRAFSWPLYQSFHPFLIVSNRRRQPASLPVSPPPQEVTQPRMTTPVLLLQSISRGLFSLLAVMESVNTL